MRFFYQHKIWTACALYTIVTSDYHHYFYPKLTPGAIMKKRDPAGDRPKFTREKCWSLMFTPQAKKNTCLFWNKRGMEGQTSKHGIQGAAQPAYV